MAIPAMYITGRMPVPRRVRGRTLSGPTKHVLTSRSALRQRFSGISSGPVDPGLQPIGVNLRPPQ